MQPRDFFYNSLLAESFGALQATIFGRELGLRRIILEGGYLQVIINSITQQDTSWNSAWMIITECLNLYFEKWNIRHVNMHAIGYVEGKLILWLIV